MDEDVRELTEDVVDDVRRVAGRLADRAKRETREAAATSVPSGGIALAGVVLATFGGLLFLAVPIVPRRNRAVRRRLIGTSVLYIAAGGAAATVGSLALREALHRRAQRAKRDLQRTATEIKQTVGEELRS